MRILALDSALARCAVGLVAGEALVGVRRDAAERGEASRLPRMAAAVLAEARVAPGALDLVAVTVGPGSFTGIRAALALAHGIGLGAGIPVVGVTVGEALAESLPHLGGRAFWCAIDSRRGRVFLERAGCFVSSRLDELPEAAAPVAIGGDAAIAVAARLAARGADVMLTDARVPDPRHVAMVARARNRGLRSPLAALPLYIDAPEVRLPVGGLRPPPAPP